MDDLGRGLSTTMSVYNAPGPVPAVTASVRKLLTENGWVNYVTPDDERRRSLLFKKGQLGLSVSFAMVGGKSDRSYVNYTADRINTDIPQPERATDIVFDGNRPFLNCVAPGTAKAILAAMEPGLAASGWARLSATEIAAKWPDARLDAAIEQGSRAYYRSVRPDYQAYQLPIMLTLQARPDNKTAVEIRVAPFAQPPEIKAGPDSAGLPAPERFKSSGSTGSADSLQREAHAMIPAEIGTVLAFYHRELLKKGWKEESKGAVINAEEVKIGFSAAEETATLQLGHKYDLTMSRLSVQVLPTVVAARQKAKKEADDRFMTDAVALAQQFVSQPDARRADAPTAAGPEAPLHALAGQAAPVPLPETAGDIKFDDAEGSLEFASTSSVKALAAFQRAAMKPLGWKETPSVINNPNMVVLEFSKAKQTVSFTIMQMGPQARVTADGDGLKAATAAPTVAAASAELEADSDAPLPVPKQHTLSAPGAWSGPGDSPFRRELDASVPADLGAVLAFYRRELTKRDWKEALGAVVKAESVLLVFTSPDGPAVLKLSRSNSETTVNLVQKNPDAAAKAGILPKPGRVRLMLGNMGDVEAAVTIDGKTTRVAPGIGGPKTPNGPVLELAPGKHKIAVKIAGRPDRNSELAVAADDSWGLMVTPGGVLPLQMY